MREDAVKEFVFDIITYGVLNGKIRSLQDAVDALASATKWIGVTTTTLTDGCTTNPITINNESVTAEIGNIAGYGNSEFVWNGSAWQEFGATELPAVTSSDNGDVLVVAAGAWAKGLLKTVNGTSLLGSGDITTGTYSKPADGIPSTDLASAVQNALLPAVSGQDDGKVPMVESGAWTLREAPGGTSDYDELENTPIYLNRKAYTQQDSIGSGLFMGVTFTKVDTDSLTLAKMIGGTVGYGVSSDLAMTTSNTFDLASSVSALGFTGEHCIVVSISGDWSNYDYVVITLDADWTFAQYGISLTAGTYIASAVTEMTLPTTVVVNPDYAGNLLPTPDVPDEGKAIQVIGGAWKPGAVIPMIGFADFTAIQRAMRSSAWDAICPPWFQLSVPHKEYGTIVFDVVAHDADLDPDNSSRKTMTLLMRDALPGMPFDATEALCVCTSGLAAGTYYLTVDSSMTTYSDLEASWSFTLTQAVPAGGVLVFNNNWLYDQIYEAVDSISSYTSLSSTTPIETAAVTYDSMSGTDLTSVISASDINYFDRACFGSGNWYQSGLRQYLNATGTGWWLPTHKFDRPPAYANKTGFLSGFPDDFLSALIETEQVTNTNEVYEIDMQVSTSADPVTYTTTDKMFCASWTQLGGSQWGHQVDEGTLWDAFRDSGSSDSPDRVKYDLGMRQSPQWWWQRSCHPYTPGNARDVYTRGAPNHSSWACDPLHAAAAACVIGAI